MAPIAPPTMPPGFLPQPGPKVTWWYMCAMSSNRLMHRFHPGSEGAQIHPKVAARPSEHVVLKHKVNSFLNTELKALLDEHKVEAVTVIGSMSHMCIDGFTRAAADFGYAVTVIHDACASRDLEFNGVTVPAAQVHAAYMASLAFAYAQVIATEEYLAGNHCDAAN